MSRALAALLLTSGAAGAQTMLDQEQRLIEVHSLLIALPPSTAPGAYQPWEASFGLELVTIPKIDGTTGGKKQITASDRTPLFPRPRLALGLPAPADFHAYVGVAYIPPVAINDVSSHLGAVEAALSWDRGGPLSIGLRAWGVIAESKSPVTDPNTRDTLDTTDVGADLSAAYRFDLSPLSVTPFGGIGVAHVSGDFTVTSDQEVLTSRTWDPAFDAGVRLYSRYNVEATAEWVVYPGRLVHPVFSIAWIPRF
ncbi:MAG TPA: hypothetical protein VLW85_03720 [Myxococcales bacterium]|nr:hypothetical protein [Myxococcales bacterium]